METSEIRTVKKARKNHVCDWCGEQIEIGTEYRTWFTFKESTTARLHPECFRAMCDIDLHDECLPPRGTYRRGCNCEEDPECCGCDFVRD